MTVSLAGTPYAKSGGASYYNSLLERVRQVPGVVSVSGTQSTPLDTEGFAGGRYNVDNTGPVIMTPVISVLPGFFTTIGGHLVAGREFSEEDVRHEAPGVVVNDAFAAGYGGPSSVIGRNLTAVNPRPPQRIIGVVRSLRYGANPAPDPQVFRVVGAPRQLTLVARVNGNARDRIGVIREAAQSVDPKVPVFNVKTMDERLDAVLSRPKFYATAVTSFGSLGLLLAVVGVYGLISFSVAQRTREMGIRLALGTTPLRLRRTLLGRTFVMVGCGAAAGVVVALALGRYLQSLVQGADSALIATTTISVALTAAISAAATWSATRRIARLDIADVLRAESGD
jgi:putative ABC transport system permease protein